MKGLRQQLAACGLACLLAVGTAAPAGADADLKALLQSKHGQPWIWSGATPWYSGLHPAPEDRSTLGQVRSTQARQDARDDFRPSQYRRGKVSSDFGLRSDGFGVEDRVAMARAGRVKVDIKDLLANDLGLKCDWPCDFQKSDKLKLTAFAGSDNIKRIVQKGKFIYVQAEARRRKATFTYEVFDQGSGATASVPVTIWFGNRAPKARKDKLVAFANAETMYDLADLLGNDRDRDGDALDLVRVWCPTGGRVFTRAVDGALKVFFQPDDDFTGVAYFKYTIADLSDPEDLLVAGPGGPSPERKTFAIGIVRVRVLASPS